MRGFKFARLVSNDEVQDEKAFKDARLPEYSTRYSAGADFFCAEDVEIPSIWSGVASVLASTAKGFIENWVSSTSGDTKDSDKGLKPTLVHTGVKACMLDDEVLEIYNRSSNPKKLGLILANSVGIIDKDYYENPSNDGEIMFAFYNIKPWKVKISAGDKIGQGIFKKFLKPDFNLLQSNDTREGGFGSTGGK
jgi:dUTP pyrophosphatase